jgi:hypothetical protein
VPRVVPVGVSSLAQVVYADCDKEGRAACDALVTEINERIMETEWVDGALSIRLNQSIRPGSRQALYVALAYHAAGLDIEVIRTSANQHGALTDLRVQLV